MNKSSQSFSLAVDNAGVARSNLIEFDLTVGLNQYLSELIGSNCPLVSGSQTDGKSIQDAVRNFFECNVSDDLVNSILLARIFSSASSDPVSLANTPLFF